MTSWYKQIAPLALALVVCGLAFLQAEAQGEDDVPDRLVILTTTYVRGEVSDRGLLATPLGGMARRATVIEQQRSTGAPILLLDGGDLPPADFRDPWPRETAAFVWDWMAKLGYDAVTPGDGDLVEGIDSLRVLYAMHPEIHVVSANVRDIEGNLLFSEYVVLDKGGTRVGITGVTSPLYHRSRKEQDQFAFDDPGAALGRVLPILADTSDLVVAILHVNTQDARRLVEENPGMDVALVGHNPGVSSPERVNETLLIRPGPLGHYVGVLSLTVPGVNSGPLEYEADVSSSMRLFLPKQM